MLKIRLQRFGKKNQPTFRIVLVDSHKGPKSGAFLEVLGSYNPRTKETAIKSERILHWIGEGAQTSDTMNNLLIKNGVIKGSKINVSSKKNVGKSKDSDEVEPKSDLPASEGGQSDEKVDDKKEETPKDEVKEEVKKEEEVSVEAEKEKPAGEKPEVKEEGKSKKE